ncbi:MAG TPA: hypothetical protein VNQ56_09390 [Pseudolabrys sp.]|nr:hypothetical protein [Pseudolabrys sp.]
MAEWRLVMPRDASRLPVQAVALASSGYSGACCPSAVPLQSACRRPPAKALLLKFFDRSSPLRTLLFLLQCNVICARRRVDSPAPSSVNSDKQNQIPLNGI